MDLAELANALYQVDVHLDWLKQIRISLFANEYINVVGVFCPKCGKKALHIRSVRRLHIATLKEPWRHIKDFTHQTIVDGQCYNPSCRHSLWPFSVRIEPELAKVAPAQARARIGDTLWCTRCKRYGVEGIERWGQVTVGHCMLCRRVILHGEIAIERWRFIRAFECHFKKLTRYKEVLETQILKLQLTP